MVSLTAAFGTLSLGRPCRTPVTASASRLGSSPALRGCQLLQGARIYMLLTQMRLTAVDHTWATTSLPG